MITQCLHSSEFTLVDKVVHSTGWLLSVAYDGILNVLRMRTRSLVPKLKTTVIGLGTRLAPVKSLCTAGTVSSSAVVAAKGTAYAVHTT